MEYRYLGRTGIRVSPLCLGTMTYGSTTDSQTAAKMVAAAVDAGVNFIDTANIYNHGESERITGRAIAALGPGVRERLVLATKCHGNMFKPEHVDDPRLARLDPNRWGNSRRQVIEQCDASLKRLGVDYIDLYQIHRPHIHCAIDETLRALDDLVHSGKVRYIGCSTFAAWQVVESLWAAEKLGLNRFVTEQPPYNLLDRRVERELIPMAQTYGLAVLPWSPLAGGYLTGKYRSAGQAPAQGRYTAADAPRGRIEGLLNNDRAIAAVEALVPLAQTKECSMGQFALAWLINQPGVTSPIVGPRTPEQLAENLGAAEITITDDDRAKVDAIIAPGTMVTPYYEADFGPHRHRL